MYAFIERNTDVIVHSANVLDEMDNGYPLFPELNIACVPENFEVAEIDGLPFNVESHKYMYDRENNTFIENPNYVAPDSTNIYGVPDEIYYKIKDVAIEQVQESING